MHSLIKDVSKLCVICRQVLFTLLVDEPSRAFAIYVKVRKIISSRDSVQPEYTSCSYLLLNGLKVLKVSCAAIMLFINSSDGACAEC